jgi:hypothetical protein
MKAYGWSIDTAPPHSASALDARGQLHVPAALASGIHYTRGWVDMRAGLDSM